MIANELRNVKVEFDSSKNLITHTFDMDVRVISDSNSGEVTVRRNGVKLRTLKDLTIPQYERLLCDTARDVETLKQFSFQM